MEWNQWVLAPSFPEDPDGEDTEPDNDRRNNLCLRPFGLGTTGKSEWDEEEGDRGDEQNSTDDVKLPEEVD